VDQTPVKSFVSAFSILLTSVILIFGCTQPHPADVLMNRDKVRPVDMVNTTYCSAIELEAFLFDNDQTLIRLCEPKIFANGTTVKFMVPNNTKMKVVAINRVQSMEGRVSVIPIVEFQVNGRHYRAGIEWLCDRNWGIEYLRPNSNWIVRCD
jgi:hypothetical protein